jgi:hypothetical protein
MVVPVAVTVLRSTLRAILSHLNEMFVDSGIGCELWVERGREHFPLLYENRMSGIFRENFHAFADRLDDGRANKNHFERFFVQLGATFVNVAGELASIGVAQHGNVHQAKRRLRGAVNITSHENGAGAGAEERAAIRSELFQLVEETLFGQDFQMRGTFAAGQDDTGKSIEIFGLADENMVDAKTVESFGVRFVITLNGENANLHFGSVPQGLNPNFSATSISELSRP